MTSRSVDVAARELSEREHILESRGIERRRPQPPAQLGKTPPVIAPLNPAGKQAQAPESLLPVTLTADLSPVQKVIQAALPERFTDENHPLGQSGRA